MTGYARGEPELHRLSSGITEQNEGETKNLGELVAEARRRHNYNRTHGARQKDENGCGIYRLSKYHREYFKQGWAWKYHFKGKRKVYNIVSEDLLEVKNKVKLSHLLWKVYDVDLAKKTAEEAGLSYDQIL